MGLHDDVADILDDKSEEEEEKKIDCSGRSKNVEIINSLMRDKNQGKKKVSQPPGKEYAEDEIQKEMSRKFIAASQLDDMNQKPNESEDSDVAPMPSIVDHTPKTEEEERVETIHNASESARVASIEHRNLKQ